MNSFRPPNQAGVIAGIYRVPRDVRETYLFAGPICPADAFWGRVGSGLPSLSPMA
jgi:hypothetical protein